MQPKTLLVMFVLMVALGGFIFFYEKDLPSTDERQELAKKVLVVEKDEVEALTIAFDDQEVRLERQDPPAKKEGEDEGLGDTFAPQASWRLVEPMAARADGAQVESLLTSLSGLEHQRVLEAVDREDAGLTDPEVRVIVATAEGDTELLFGAELPASSDRIVGVAGRTEGYVVANTVVADLKKEPIAWRDKKLFTEERRAIEEITLAQGEERVVLARRGEDFWLQHPLEDQADGDAVNGLLTAVTGLTVKTFLDQPLLDPIAMGIEPAQAVLEVALQGREEPFLLELGESVEGETRYGRVEGELFELNAGLAPSLALSPAAWRSRDWGALQVFQINSATFTDSSGATTIRREEADWLRGDEKIEYSTASDLLYAVADAKAESVLGVSGTLGAPDLTVELSSEDREETLYLYTTETGAMASREGREAILAMSGEAVEEVLSKLKAVREAEVLQDEEGEEEE